MDTMNIFVRIAPGCRWETALKRFTIQEKCGCIVAPCLPCESYLTYIRHEIQLPNEEDWVVIRTDEVIPDLVYFGAGWGKGPKHT